MGHKAHLNCFRTFLIVTFIAVRGEPVTVEEGVDITPGNLWLRIWIGLFFIMLSVIGVIGAIFAHHIVGRILLGLYGFVLTIAVILEITSGAAAEMVNQGADRPAEILGIVLSCFVAIVGMKKENLYQNEVKKHYQTL